MKEIIHIVFFAFGVAAAAVASERPVFARKSSLLPRRVWGNENNDPNSNNDGYQPATPASSSKPNLAELYNNDKTDVLLRINFARDDPERWNPRNNNSEVAWRFLATGYPADNAYYELPNDAYGNRDRCGPDSKQPIIVSLPYHKYYSKNDPRSEWSCDEGGHNWKGRPNVTNTQRIVTRLQIKCRIVDADKNPFPKRLVTNQQDMR